MKCYQYDFFISYGQGQGIIFAENKKDARWLLETKDVYGINVKDIAKIKLVEIDMKKTKLIDFGWSE